MLRPVKKIFELEAATGILLFIVTVAALLIANSSHFAAYHQFFSFSLPINLDFVNFHKNLTIRDWINDALMALFFLLIGLELKEEVLRGELSTKARAALPLIAACGGVILPALIFYFFNHDQPQNLRAMAVPTATDIAFAYGVLCLFGKKIPKSLKVFLISLAIFDDLIAILIIAIFYSQDLNFLYLSLAFLVIFFLTLLNFTKSSLAVYMFFGAILWLMFLKSGIHATIAGVTLAAFIPHKNDLLKNLIKKIAPSVNFLILPIFAFANSGVAINNFSLEILATPLILGIIFALFFGKQAGVMLFSFIAIKFGITHLPRSPKGEVKWLEFYGVAILTGIGFTMSFFIGALAFFDDPALFDQVKIAVLLGSFLSMIFGILLTYLGLPKDNKNATKKA